jgi:hypothetical protein
VKLQWMMETPRHTTRTDTPARNTAMRYPRAMHDWHGIAVWLGILFVIVPALAGGVVGFVLYRRKLGSGGSSLQGLIGGAVIGAAAGAGIAVLLFRY